MKILERATKSNGMTLVELMVALSIVGVIMALSVSFFYAQFESYYSGKENKKVQITNLDVTELLRSELAEAGWSVSGDMAFAFVDGGSGGSDAIFINDTSIIDPATDLGLLITDSCAGGAAIAATGTDNQVALTSTSAAAVINNFVDTSNSTQGYIITNSTTLSTKTAQITAYDSGNSTIDLASAVDGSTAAPAVYYYVANNMLMRWDRTSAGAQPVASNIVDLQVTYQDTDGYWYGAAGCNNSGTGANGFCSRNPFAPSSIQLVTVTLTTRSDNKTGGSGSDSRYCRPAVNNRNADATGSADCGYIYRSFTITVRPRNT